MAMTAAWPVRRLLAALAVAAAYYGAAKFGLALAYENSSVTAVWPPTGIALAALLLGSYRLWPGIALGAFLANAWTGVSPETVLAITLGNTLEALAGAYLLQRFSGFDPRLERVRDVVSLTVLAAMASTLISATIGVAGLRLGTDLPADRIAETWRTWWLGDMAGDLIVAPFILIAVLHLRRGLRRPRRPGEVAVLGLTLAGLSVLAFSQTTPVAYVVFPCLIWAALRFRQVGATTASLVVAGVAVAFTANGEGPFVQASGDDSLLLSQTFVSVAGLTALLLAAIATELARAERASAIQRRRQALEINDGIIQGLAIASYQIDQGDGNSRAVIADTLRKARQLVDQLLYEDHADVAPGAGHLRRAAAASVGGDGEEPPHARRAAD
jgi:integral membrane sensor domain MASE1